MTFGGVCGPLWLAGANMYWTIDTRDGTLPCMTQALSQSAERGDIFGTSTGLIVRVKRVGRTGWVDVQIIGGARDGYSQRMRHGIPADWSRYPR